VTEKVGVVGSGTMGTGIAQVLAAAGNHVVLLDVAIERVQRAIASIESILMKQVAKGKIAEETVRETVANISPTTDYQDLATCTIVIEAVFEDLNAKKAVIEAVSSVAPEAILATNTSSISISRLAALHPVPAQVVGMHFFNPVPLMPLVEVIRAEQTSDAVVARVMELANQCGKTAVEVADVPGFAVNRLLIPMINEAIICLESGVASREALDQTMTLGASHPMGPLALADLIGLDVVLSIMEVLHRDLGEDKYRPAVMLRRMVAAGRLGRKSGQGFYAYN